MLPAGHLLLPSQALPQLASELVGRGQLGRVGSHPTIVPKLEAFGDQTSGDHINYNMYIYIYNIIYSVYIYIVIYIYIYSDIYIYIVI